MCDTKICHGCGEYKPLSDFYYNTCRKLYTSRCKSCIKIKARIYRLSVRIYPMRQCNAKKTYTTWRSKNKSLLLYSNAKYRAKRENMEFNLDRSDTIIPETCPVLGIPLIPASKYHDYNSPTLDRIDSSKGYIKGNVCIISWRANSLKKNGTLDEFLKIIEYMKKSSISKRCWESPVGSVSHSNM